MTASCLALTRPGRSRRSPAARWRPCAGSSPETLATLAGYRESHRTGGAMRLRQDEPIEVKTPAQLELMRQAGLITAAALQAAAAAAGPGVSTAEVHALAEGEIRAAGG